MEALRTSHSVWLRSTRIKSDIKLQIEQRAVKLVIVRYKCESKRQATVWSVEWGDKLYNCPRAIRNNDLLGLYEHRSKHSNTSYENLEEAPRMTEFGLEPVYPLIQT